MTTEHLKILLDSAAGSSLLGDVATLFGRGQLPEDILTVVRVGRMTALQKPDGGVRLWRELKWLQARWQRWQSSPTQSAALKSPGVSCADTLD